jgi:DNA-binding transcriptional LysR family regulator
MELRDLRYFIAVAEELHFGRAAARLHISPPPLTQHIKRLEAMLDVSLFNRTKRSVALTPGGAALLVHARQLLAQADSLANIVQRASLGEAGYLRTGVIGSSIFSNARTLQALLAKRLPDVRLVWHELSSREQIEAIQRDRLDLGFIITPIDHEGLVVRAAIREPLVVVVPSSHPLAVRKSIRLESLKHEAFVLCPRHVSPGYYDRFISACNAAGFSPNVVHHAEHMLTYIGLVALGAGVSIVPASMIHSGIAGVSFLKILGTHPYSEVSLVWKPDNDSPVLARVLQAIEWPILPKRAGAYRPRTTALPRSRQA